MQREEHKPARVNEYGQPIGPALESWSPPPWPPREPMAGRYCDLEPLQPERHAAALFEAMDPKGDAASWTYLSYGPFGSLAEYRRWMERAATGDDPLFFVIRAGEHRDPLGVASYLRITPAHGTIEVGHIYYTPPLRRTGAATEAMALMMRRAFELGYRRYEWKCDALNAASRAAAERLGFVFEGVFRNAIIYKGRSRDTAWYSVIDEEWPALERAFSRWLDPDNFDAHGNQLTSLRAWRASGRAN
ncbi:MAG: GNAT family N-acetyltransferase [Spirochaetaceae bacterium]